MDKKRLEYYKKKLQARREELLKSIARTEEEGRSADDDPTVDLADKAANSYTKEFLFGQNNTDRATLATDRRGARAHQEQRLRPSASIAKRNCSRSAWKRCRGLATAPLARKSTSRDCSKPR